MRQNYKIYLFPTLAGTKLPPLSFSFSPNFVLTILSAASEKCVASSGSTPELLRSEDLSFCSLPSTSFIMALFGYERETAFVAVEIGCKDRKKLVHCSGDGLPVHSCPTGRLSGNTSVINP